MQALTSTLAMHVLHELKLEILTCFLDVLHQVSPLDWHRSTGIANSQAGTIHILFQAYHNRRQAMHIRKGLPELLACKKSRPCSNKTMTCLQVEAQGGTKVVACLAHSPCSAPTHMGAQPSQLLSAQCHGGEGVPVQSWGAVLQAAHCGDAC